MSKRLSHFLPLLWLAPLVLVLDQATKLYVDRAFFRHESVTIFENFFHFTYVRNQGAAFGILADSSIRLPFFIIVSLIAVLGILWYYAKLQPQQNLLRYALVLVLSGAAGNLIDRIRLGEVIDFIDVHWYQHHWPAFNIADSAITIGVGLLLIDLWQEEKSKRSAG